MALEIIEIHPAEKPKLLNTEWIVLQNKGDAELSLRHCAVATSKPHGKKIQATAKLDPGFRLEAGAKKRIVSGNPRSKVQGAAPEDEIENYHLFYKVALYTRPQTQIRIMRGQMTLARAIWDPQSAHGVAAVPVPQETEK